MKNFLDTVKRSSLWKMANVHFDKLLLGGIIYFVAVMLGYTWKAWADPQIDFGRELYIPWQLSEGKVLYRDIFHIFGPFSQYFNALLFKIFGVSWNVLIITNTILLIGFGWLLYKIMCNLGNKIVGSVCVIFFYLNFSFAHYYEIGNYNYIAPYAHEAIHGLYLTFILFYFSILRFSIFVLGTIFGFIIMTKPEFIVASGVFLVLHFFKLSFWHSRTLIINSVLLITGVLLPLSLSTFYFFSFGELELKKSTEYTLQAIIMVIKFNPINNAFYQDVSGFSDIRGNLFQQIRALFMLLVCLMGLYYFIEKKSFDNKFRLILSVLIVFAFLYYFESMSIGSAFLGITLFLIILLFYKSLLIEVGGFSNLGEFSILSIFLLLKSLLNVEIHHYGFVLAVGTSLCFIYFLVKVWEYFHCKNRYLLQLMSVLLIIGISISNFKKTLTMYSEKTFLLCGKYDVMRLLPPDFYYIPDHILLLQRWIESRNDISTLVIIPEGIMINYLNRIPSPIGMINFLPHEIKAAQEYSILEKFICSPPKYIVFIYRDLSEYGYHKFGDNDYGILLYEWITTYYQCIYSLDNNCNDTSFSPCLGVYKYKL